MVPGLGLFQFFPQSTALVDGETCIAAADGVGRWELALPGAELSMAFVEDRVSSTLSSEFVPVLSATATLSFGSIPAQSGVNKTIAVTGAAVGNTPPPTLPNTLICSAWVSATGTVTVRLSNVTASAATPASAAFTVNVFTL